MANQTRNTYFSRIYELMQRDERIVIISVDLAGPPFDKIRDCFPKRYIPVGIAEQNAISVACGLASIGKKVIVYAANPFTILRAFDQIRNAVCAMKLPITIVGLGTGFSVAECGSTHLTLEDVALTSLCAGLKIYSPSDNNSAYYLANEIQNVCFPTYIRFGKWAGENLGDINGDIFTCGYRKIKEGKDVAIVATGCSCKLLMDMGLSDRIAIFDWFEISNVDALVNELRNYTVVISVEEMLLRGGIGSILLEEFSDKGIASRIKRIGIILEKGYPQEYGDRKYWLEKYNITSNNINRIVEEMDNRI